MPGSRGWVLRLPRVRARGQNTLVPGLRWVHRGPFSLQKPFEIIIDSRGLLIWCALESVLTQVAESSPGDHRHGLPLLQIEGCAGQRGAERGSASRRQEGGLRHPGSSPG